MLRSVSLRIEKWWREEKVKHNDNVELPDIASTSLESVSKEICHAAAKMGKQSVPFCCLILIKIFKFYFFFFNAIVKPSVSILYLY